MNQPKSGSIDDSILDLIKESLQNLAAEISAEQKFYSLVSPEEGFNYHWFIDAKTRFLERFPPGIKVEIIEDFNDDNYLCLYNGRTIIIKKDKISHEVLH